ncbi:MAG: NAD+ synthase [Elainellaceae cyanobacterium]
MKIAIAQLNPIIGDLAGNAQQILDAAHRAADQGARLMLTPEMSISGYPPRDLLMQPSFVANMADTVEQLASDIPSTLAVLVGTAELNERSLDTGGKPLFNSIVLLDGGRIQHHFHKRLLPTYDVFDDDRYFSADSQSNFFTLEPTDSIHSPIRVGVTICEDLWNDEEFWGKRNYKANPLDDLAAQSVDLIVNLSGSPYSLGKQRLREAMLNHAAMRYRIPILYVNQVGGNDDLIFDGSSVGFNRSGQVVCRAKAFQPDLAIAEFDPERRDFLASPITALPESDDAEIWSALVLGVRDYAHKCGFSKVVIGLSGGIDSSLVAAIATAAFGAENVLGVLMPSPYSSEHSVRDANDLAANLGIRTETLPIQDLMTAYDQTFAELFAGTEIGVAEENIQSRIRGNLLMAIANKFSYLLLSTGNKSEMAVGYCTLYGDMNGGLAAIADVPKTRVYSLCRWLNEQATHQPNQENGQCDPPFPVPRPALSSTEIISSNVLSKPPSAELKPGQVDQDALPSYDILDDILHRLIHEHESPRTIAAAGHDPHTIDKIVKLVTRAEFKRKQAPPALKVTDRAFGTGWRMPIACKWSVASAQSVSKTTESSETAPPAPSEAAQLIDNISP